VTPHAVVVAVSVVDAMTAVVLCLRLQAIRRATHARRRRRHRELQTFDRGSPSAPGTWLTAPDAVATVAAVAAICVLVGVGVVLVGVGIDVVGVAARVVPQRPAQRSKAG
jgi:hypothetical protein